jgi:hypothetical protein
MNYEDIKTAAREAPRKRIPRFLPHQVYARVAEQDASSRRNFRVFLRPRNFSSVPRDSVDRPVDGTGDLEYRESAISTRNDGKVQG